MKKIFLLVFFLSSVAVVNAQTRANCPVINLTYDAAGNRILRAPGTVSCKVSPTGLDDVDANSSFKVYPNPTQDKINIELADENDFSVERTVQLFDINGKMLQNKVMTTHHLEMNVEALAPGIYLLKIMQGKEYKSFIISKN